MYITYLALGAVFVGFITGSNLRIFHNVVNRSGQSAEVAEYNLLDTARKIELYGIQMHPARVGVVYIRITQTHELNCFKFSEVYFRRIDTHFLFFCFCLIFTSAGSSNQ
jgi:hypothetical protein